ncbi:MAG: hypothetical protein HWN81_00080 [Candidatus Lokiarchaeota archaeon]|nr:hypothetical protein [Candidatus Lokiarchaeota archaeon]
MFWRRKEITPLVKRQLETIRSTVDYMVRQYKKEKEILTKFSYGKARWFGWWLDSSNALYLSWSNSWIDVIKETYNANGFCCKKQTIRVHFRDIPSKIRKQLIKEIEQSSNEIREAYRAQKEKRDNGSEYNKCEEILRITDDSINDIVLGANEED